MNRQSRIENSLEILEPLVLRVENESHSHNVPQNSETHFKVFIVSQIFEGMSRIDRQRRVNQILAPELSIGLHALTMKLMTPQEYSHNKSDFVSPPCHGGSLKDKK